MLALIRRADQIVVVLIHWIVHQVQFVCVILTFVEKSVK